MSEMKKWSNTFYSAANGQNFTRFYAALRTALSLGLIKILFIFYTGLHVVYFECTAPAKIGGDMWHVEASGNIEKCFTEPPELPVLCARYCGFPRRCHSMLWPQLKKEWHSDWEINVRCSCNLKRNNGNEDSSWVQSLSKYYRIALTVERQHARTHTQSYDFDVQSGRCSLSGVFCIVSRTGRVKGSYCVSLFVCGLLKDYVASKDQMIIENESKRMWKEVVVV